MDEYQYEDLAEAWHKLTLAHLDFEQVPAAGTQLYRDRYDALVLALEKYQHVVDRMKLSNRMSENKEAGGD